MSKDKSTQEKIDKALPDVKVGRTESTKFREKVNYTHPTKGKKKTTISGENFSEYELDDVHLTKIAPMLFISEETNKILMIPFSIKYSPQEFAEWLAQASVNVQQHFDKKGKEVANSGGDNNEPKEEAQKDE